MIRNVTWRSPRCHRAIDRCLRADDSRIREFGTVLAALMSALSQGVSRAICIGDLFRPKKHRIAHLARRHWESSPASSILEFAQSVRSLRSSLTYRQCALSQFAYEQAGLLTLAAQLKRSASAEQIQATIDALIVSTSLRPSRYMDLLYPIDGCIPTHWKSDLGLMSEDTNSAYRTALSDQRESRNWPSQSDQLLKLKLIFYKACCLLLAIGITSAFGTHESLHTLGSAATFGSLLLLAFIASAPVIEFLVGSIIEPAPILRLDFVASGLPECCRVVLAVPIVLVSKSQLDHVIENAVWNLSSAADENVSLALLSDHPDSGVQDESHPEAALRAYLAERVDQLRANGLAINLLHRSRTQFIDSSWIGWERKRGKLLQLNSVILGEKSALDVVTGDLDELVGARYVLSLDEDSRLSRDCVQRLAGVLAHPLNEPRWDSGSIVGGYAIVVPRFSTRPRSLTHWRMASAFCGPIASECAPVASSRNFLFDWVSRTQYPGKGMYDVRAFQRASRDLPEGCILSHDTIEGALLRCAYEGGSLISESFPRSPASLLRRIHRWTRGDIQNYQIFWASRRQTVRSALARTSFGHTVNMQLCGMALPGALSIALLAWAFQAPASSRTLFCAITLIGVWPTVQTVRRMLGYVIQGAVSKAARDVLGLLSALTVRLAGCWTQGWVVACAGIQASASAISGKHLLEWQTAAAQDADAQSIWNVPGVALASTAAIALFGAAVVLKMPFGHSGIILVWALYPSAISFAAVRRTGEA